MSNTEFNGFRPLFERVLIQPDEPEKQTSTGIILPSTSIKRPNTGIVKAIGELALKSANIKVGDKVLYLRYSGFDTTINGVDYHLVMANDLVGVINNSKGNTTFELKDYNT